VVEATIDGIHAAMRTRQLTCTQSVQAYLDRIAAYDKPAEAPEAGLAGAP